jgi:hypothetical protein
VQCHRNPGPLSDGAIGTIILRVLHEHMESRYKVVRSLKGFTKAVAVEGEGGRGEVALSDRVDHRCVIGSSLHSTN